MGTDGRAGRLWPRVQRPRLVQSWSIPCGGRPSSVVSGGRRVVVVVVLVDVPELEVSVLEVLEVVVSSPGLMSVVTGGLVLVMISVVEVADDEYVAELDPLGSSTKYCGACSGWLYCLVTYDARRNRMPITTRPATLAPITVDVRSCHGRRSGSSSRSPVTGTDSSRGRRARARSGEPAGDLGEHLEVIQVGHVEHLEVHALDAGLDERAQPVDDLLGRADQW